MRDGGEECRVGDSDASSVSALTPRRNLLSIRHHSSQCRADVPGESCIPKTLEHGAQEEERAGRCGAQRQRLVDAAARQQRGSRSEEGGQRALDVCPHHLSQQVSLGGYCRLDAERQYPNSGTIGIGATSLRSTAPGSSFPLRSSSRSPIATTSPRARTPLTPPSSTTLSRSARRLTRPPTSLCAPRRA